MSSQHSPESEDQQQDEESVTSETNGDNDEIVLEPIDFELPSSATVLYSPFTNATIILVGSIHVHQSSSDEVSDIIRRWKPDTVFIELCASRAGLVLNSIDSRKVTYINRPSSTSSHSKQLQSLQQQQQHQHSQQHQPSSSSKRGGDPSQHNQMIFNRKKSLRYKLYNRRGGNNLTHFENSDDGDDEFQPSTTEIESSENDQTKIVNQHQHHQYKQKIINNNNNNQNQNNNNNNNNMEMEEHHQQIIEQQLSQFNDEQPGIMEKDIIMEEQNIYYDKDNNIIHGNNNNNNNNNENEQQEEEEKEEKMEEMEEDGEREYYYDDDDESDETRSNSQDDGSDSSSSSYEADDECSNSPMYTTTPPTPVDSEDHNKRATLSEMIALVKENGLPGLLQVLMAEMIRKAGNQSKVGPGAEFITAYLESKKVGAKIVLGDRLVEITLQRVWNSLTRWEKIKFVFYLFIASFSEVTEQDIDALKNSDEQLVEKLLEEFKEKFPSVVRSIVTERDQYMAARLRMSPGRKIVAIVGKGHVGGIIREWTNYSIDLSLLESPFPNSMGFEPPSRFDHGRGARATRSYNNSISWLRWATFLIIPATIASAAIYFYNHKWK
ncbi:hypothetical protein DFA_03543 [Cavenderia fasciculata]|uniref:TraB family protein n=1 Tax=Cavenderia fasciculata TaxID=261658 RepID=F4PHW0_CACFS|nr:uncharacterized protein DFA_03543 [Cavenderia fasciculata]EGG25294.1 hypothetical protein DFA_03543 [Cavenderia fasciculata]|eukprot:XP_004363145.1 hypothetical protein DFA_03543 [Cavenderia fasciculata]